MKSSVSSGTVHKRSRGASDAAKQLPRTGRNKCDLCQMGGKRWHLQQCKICGVCVHETCYGLAETARRDPNFVCKACAAVGKTVPVRTRKGPDAVSSLVQKKRPTECALCSVSHGIHAMHPLYDAHGRNGRQLVLPADEKKGLPQRLGWAHSLCAFVLTQQGSLVYACDRKGRYADEDGEWRYSDDESESDKNEEEDPQPTHHFVVCGKKDGEHTPYSWEIKERKNTLTCTFCGARDKQKGVVRFAAQCTAGNECEYYNYTHKELSDPCTVALHVGCAMWGSSPGVRNVYFYPGAAPDNDEAPYQDAVAEMYCPAHAKDVAESTLEDDGPTKKAPVKKLQTAKRALPTAVSQPARRNQAYERRLLKRKDIGSKAKAGAKRARLASPIASPTPHSSGNLKSTSGAKRAKTVRPWKHSLKTSPEELAKPLKISSRSSSVTVAARPMDEKSLRRHSAPEANPLGGLEALAFPKRRLSSEREKPTRESATQGPAPTPKQKDTGEDTASFIRFRDDLLQKMQEALVQGKDTKLVGNKCRDKWVEESGLPAKDWKPLWVSAKKYVKQAFAAPVQDKPPPSPNRAPLEQNLPQKASVATQSTRKSRWSHLWVGDPNFSGDYEFGDWDSFKVVSRI